MPQRPSNVPKRCQGLTSPGGGMLSNYVLSKIKFRSNQATKPCQGPKAIGHQRWAQGEALLQQGSLCGLLIVKNTLFRRLLVYYSLPLSF